MTTIIVASDLSERSREATRRGVNLAATMGARLKVMHVLDAGPGDLAERKRAAGDSLAEHLAADVEGRDIDHEIEVLTGDVVEEINKSAEASKAGLLIVGLHERRVFLDNVKETTMEHLIRASDLPVLLVANKADSAYAKVLAGVDLSPVCASALHKVRRIAPEADLHLFHAHEVSFAKEARLDFDTWRVTSDLPTGLDEPSYFEGSATDALEELMAGTAYDLLVIGAHTRTARHRYLLGSFSAKMIRNPPCDVLIAK